MTQSCKLFVGAYDDEQALVLFYSDELGDAIEMRGIDVLELVGSNNGPPSDGLWMFVGAVDPNLYGGRPWGSWRRPTVAESLAAACGQNPCVAPYASEDEHEGDLRAIGGGAGR